MLAERIRSFTQYVGCLLLRRDFETLSGLFTDAVVEKNAPSRLEETLNGHEKDHGSFDCFDHVAVAVYCERHQEADTSDVMRLPKGIAPEQRRGESSLKLVSAYTPNGMAIHTVTVFLDVVEEGGRFKLADMRWVRD